MILKRFVIPAILEAATRLSKKDLFDDTIENICRRIQGYRNKKGNLNDYEK